MIKNRIKIGIFCLAFLLTAFTGERKVKVYLIGDSTIANKAVTAYPETGWGMPFSHFFNEHIEVDNRALNGRSTSTFMKGGKWKPVMDSLQKGDYVFIQFGHNDEVKTKGSYTTETEFRDNLTKYVNDVRSKAAFPVLLTPVARRNFDAAGKVLGTHDLYSSIVRSVAASLNVPLIDLDVKSQELLQQYGAEGSRHLFNQLKAGEHPNYPEGKEDNTHFNELGAREMAQIVLHEIKALNLPLANDVFKPASKK